MQLYMYLWSSGSLVNALMFSLVNNKINLPPQLNNPRKVKQQLSYKVAVIMKIKISLTLCQFISECTNWRKVTLEATSCLIMP